MIKSLFDYVAAIVLLLLFSPILLITWMLVRLKLGKPSIFKQERIGLKNEIFFVYKFRTMTDEKDECGHLLSDEKRLTAFGKWLRSTSIDELPQLWNVLRGDMSFVGPRPLITSYLPLYNNVQIRRHEVKPGITGWAQVNGRNGISWDEKFTHDIFYVDNRSIFFDLKIILLTVKKVMFSENVNSKNFVTMENFTGNKKLNNKDG